MNDAISFYATSENEIMRITKDGIWVKPGMPIDDLAKAVLDLLGEYVKKMVQTAVMEEREACAQWMIEKGYATGHGDSVADLLEELEWQIREREREACAKADEQGSCIACGNRITHPIPQQVEATAQKGGDKVSPTSKSVRTCKYCNNTYTANAFTTRTGFTCKWCAAAIRARGEE